LGAVFGALTPLQPASLKEVWLFCDDYHSSKLDPELAHQTAPNWQLKCQSLSLAAMAFMLLSIHEPKLL